MNKLYFLDLFAGIGGFRRGFENAGFECVGHCEIDKFAQKSYKAIHNIKEDEVFFNDITKVTDKEWRELGENKQIDIITAGFPCQAFSIAGKRRGFDDARGTLFFELARAVKQIKPPLLLFENVRGLLSHGGGLHSAEYSGFWTSWGTTVNGKCLTAKISEFHRTGQECSLSDILEKEVDEKYYLSNEKTMRLINQL